MYLLRPVMAIWLSCVSVAVFAAPAPGPPTLDIQTSEEAVRAALGRSPFAAAAKKDVEAARFGVRAARALRGPEIRVTPALDAGGSDEEFLASQPLELSGARSARTSVAQAQLSRTEAEARADLIDLAHRARSAFFEAVHSQERLHISRELADLAKELNDATARQVEIGVRPGIDRTVAGIELERATQQLETATGEARAALAALGTLTGGGTLGADARLPEAVPLMEVEQAVAEARANSPAVLAGLATQRELQMQARLERAEGRPDVAVQYREEELGAASGSGLGVSIQIPIFDYGARRNRIRQLEAASQSHLALSEDAALRAEEEARQAHARAVAARAVVASYGGGLLERARKVVESTRIGVSAGQTAMVQLLEAQRTYGAVLGEYATARRALAQADADLERAMGLVFAPQASKGELQK